MLTTIGMVGSVCAYLCPTQERIELREEGDTTHFTTDNGWRVSVNYRANRYQVCCTPSTGQGFVAILTGEEEDMWAALDAARA